MPPASRILLHIRLLPSPPPISPMLMFLFPLRPPPASTLFPYTTLFRSQQAILFKRFEIFQLQGVLLFESDTALLRCTPGEATRSPNKIFVANPPAAHNLHDDSLSDSVFFAENQLMDNRQHPLIQHLIVTSQIFCILIEPHLILGDGRHAERDHLQLGMSAVSLKISLECTVAKRLAQRILFLGEMIHSDKLILSAPELLHRQQKHLGFLFG